MSLASDAADSAVATKYIPLLTEAISRVPQASPELRRNLYERARTELETLLHTLEPPVAEALMAKQLALDEAISRVEGNGIPAKPKDQRWVGDGWLAKLIKQAPLDLEPFDQPVEMPLSAMDFAPKRARQNETEPRPQADPLPCFKTDGLEGSRTPERPIGNIDAILRKLHEEAHGVEASAFISSGGSIVASALSFGVEQARIAGVVETLKRLGSRAATQMARGAAREVIIHGEEGYAVLISTGGGALLLALTDRSSKLGEIFSRMYEAIEQLGDDNERTESPGHIR